MSDRKRQQATKRERGKQRGQDLSLDHYRAIEALVHRTAAQDLERMLLLRLITFAERGVEEEEAEITDEGAEEDEEGDNPFDNMDAEDFELDEEGDFTEPDESPLLLEGIGLDTPEEQNRIMYPKI